MISFSINHSIGVISIRFISVIILTRFKEEYNFYDKE